MTRSKQQYALDRLLDEVEALCRVYVGKNAESEAWGKTCERLETISKLAKAYRRLSTSTAA